MDELERQCADMMETMGAEYGMADGGSGMMGMGGMMGLGLLWIVLAAAVIGLLVAGAIWLVQRREPAAASIPENARQTLDRRYASGEVARDTYLQMRSDLDGRDERIRP